MLSKLEKHHLHHEKPTESKFTIMVTQNQIETFMKNELLKATDQIWHCTMRSPGPLEKDKALHSKRPHKWRVG